MSHTVRRTLLAALVATVAGLSLADAAFAQGKGGNDRGGNRGGLESGPGAIFDANMAKIVVTHVPPTHNRKPRRLRSFHQVSCEGDADLNVYNSADRRKCNQPTKRIRQAYLSCETVYVAVPGGYIPERVCTRGN